MPRITLDTVQYIGKRSARQPKAFCRMPRVRPPCVRRLTKDGDGRIVGMISLTIEGVIPMLEEIVAASERLIAIIGTDTLYIPLVIIIMPLCVFMVWFLWTRIVRPVWYVFCHCKGWLFEEDDPWK